MTYSILEQIMLPDGNRIVLYDMPVSGAHAVSNLVCEAGDGTKRWAATPGQFGPDYFVAVRLDGDLLFANTWSGYELRLDPASGSEVSRVFTK